MPARGTGKYGPDIIVGSSEYWKKWREDNKDKQKLAMARYRFKQKQLIMAKRLAETDGITTEQALREIKGEMVTLRTLEKVLIADGRLATKNDPVEVDDTAQEEQDKFILDQAKHYNVEYNTAFTIMDKEANPEKWARLFYVANYHQVYDRLPDDILPEERKFIHTYLNVKEGEDD